MTFDQAVQGVRSRIIRAVETRLRSDVPLAFCMSGGIDSNSLIAAAKRALGCDVHGFTVQDPDRRYAEADQVRLVVDRLGLRHTSVPTDTAGFLPGLRALIQYHDAPLYTVTYYAHARLMDSIADHGYKIAVSGAGADEIFSGYYDHHLYYLAEIQNRPQYFPQAVDNWERLVKPDIRNPVLRDLEAFLINPDPGRYIDDETDAVRPFLTPDQSESFHQRDYFPGALRNRMANEIFEEVIPPILHEDDLNAMRRSIENRSPFLDPDLYEFSLTIPTRHLIRNGYAKAVLRQAMRGLVPDPILDRREKIGFNAPIMSYLDPADPEVRSFIASDSPVFDWVRRDRLLELIDRPRPPNWASKFLFNFLCAKMFLELF
jgi:asparagine synthase (glutamine-hydrolysing)